MRSKLCCLAAVRTLLRLKSRGPPAFSHPLLITLRAFSPDWSNVKWRSNTATSTGARTATRRYRVELQKYDSPSAHYFITKSSDVHIRRSGPAERISVSVRES